MHHFHTKLPDQKLMLRQIECWVQNEPITKNRTDLMYQWPKCPVFVFFTRAEVLFDGSFSLWVSLKYEKGDRRDGEYNL